MDLLPFLKAHRRRIARVIAIIAFAVIGMHLMQNIPQDSELRYDLGPAHQEVVALQISYQVEGGEVAGVRFQYRAGAPRVVRHTVSLIPGRYDVVATLNQGRSSRRIERAIDTPAEGVIHVDLFDLTYASVIQLRSND